jgi:hypothetical protein
MATKKQRRRRAKEQRHEYVWVDDEGNEVEPDGTEGSADRPRSATRFERDPQAPSWRRTLRRGAIFAPIMLGVVFLLSPELSLAQKVTQTLLLVGIFVPFSYFIDRFFYRSHQRRRARSDQATGRRGS